MISIDDVINYILTTDDLSDLPTIGDALNERYATELGYSVEMPTEELTVEETPTEEVVTDEVVDEWANPFLSL